MIGTRTFAQSFGSLQSSSSVSVLWDEVVLRRVVKMMASIKYERWEEERERKEEEKKLKSTRFTTDGV